MDAVVSGKFISVIFNRDGDVALSQTDHIMYPGPWLEMLRLPVKENKDRSSASTTKIIEFLPLCHHFNEAECKQDIFSCTVHAVCWEFLTLIFSGDKEISTKKLPKLWQLLQENMLTPDALALTPNTRQESEHFQIFSIWPYRYAASCIK